MASSRLDCFWEEAGEAERRSERLIGTGGFFVNCGAETEGLSSGVLLSDPFTTDMEAGESETTLANFSAALTSRVTCPSLVIPIDFKLVLSMSCIWSDVTNPLPVKLSRYSDKFSEYSHLASHSPLSPPSAVSIPHLKKQNINL